jgi:hypothetical protein
VHPPMPYKRWENRNYCHTHGGDVEDAHTSATCNRQGPIYNLNATWANMMGGSPAGMHKTILPSASRRTPPPPLPAAATAATASHLLLPHAEYLAATSCAVWTAIHLCSAPSAARHCHDQLRRAVSPKRNDPPAANAPAAAA